MKDYTPKEWVKSNLVTVKKLRELNAKVDCIQTVPTPTVSEAGKYVKVGADGKYELGSASDEVVFNFYFENFGDAPNPCDGVTIEAIRNAIADNKNPVANLYGGCMTSDIDNEALYVISLPLVYYEIDSSAILFGSLVCDSFYISTGDCVPLCLLGEIVTDADSWSIDIGEPSQIKFINADIVDAGTGDYVSVSIVDSYQSVYDKINSNVPVFVKCDIHENVAGFAHHFVYAPIKYTKVPNTPVTDFSFETTDFTCYCILRNNQVEASISWYSVTDELALWGVYDPMMDVFSNLVANYNDERLKAICANIANPNISVRKYSTIKCCIADANDHSKKYISNCCYIESYYSDSNNFQLNIYPFMPSLQTQPSVPITINVSGSAITIS